MSPATRTASLLPRLRRRATSQRVALAGVALLAILMRVWDLGSRPGYDWDEPVYADIGASVAHGDGLFLKTPIGGEHAHYLFHPPFYFWLLGGWMRIFGTGIPSARLMAASMSLVVLTLLYTLMRRRWGAFALLPLAVLATDGWLLFSNRVSWIENTMLVIAVGAILAYDRALRSHRVSHYALAGALVGATVIAKHVGIYVLLAVLCTWIVVRGDHRGHLRLVGVALLVIGAYVVAMVLLFKHDYLSASHVQIERLTGHKEARGSIKGGGQVISALIGPYKVYVPTLTLSALSLLALARRSVIFLRRRGDASVVPDPVLFGWAAAAGLTFAASGLKMAHYFMLIEIPLLLYLASELIALVPERPPRRTFNLAVTGLVCLLAANFVTFDLRFASRHDNALGQLAAYARADLPPQAILLTEETIGTIAPQPYCKFFRVGACGPAADYVITYTSRTQAPPPDPRLTRLIRASKPVKVFHGFKETITVYKTPKT